MQVDFEREEGEMLEKRCGITEGNAAGKLSEVWKRRAKFDWPKGIAEMKAFTASPNGNLASQALTQSLSPSLPLSPLFQVFLYVSPPLKKWAFLVWPV